MIRVSVDHQGHALAFNIVQGDKAKAPAALAAAKRWAFQPCSGDAGCDHTLKYTARGNTSSLQMVD